MGTRGRGHRDACVGTWDLGTRDEGLEDIKYGTRGRQKPGRRGRGVRIIIAKVGGKCDISHFTREYVLVKATHPALLRVPPCTLPLDPLLHLPPTFALIIHIQGPLRPGFWRPRDPRLASPSPKSPHTRPDVPVPLSPSHFYTQPYNNEVSLSVSRLFTIYLTRWCLTITQTVANSGTSIKQRAEGSTGIVHYNEVCIY